MFKRAASSRGSRTRKLARDPVRTLNVMIGVVTAREMSCPRTGSRMRAGALATENASGQPCIATSGAMFREWCEVVLCYVAINASSNCTMLRIKMNASRVVRS